MPLRACPRAAVTRRGSDVDSHRGQSDKGWIGMASDDYLGSREQVLQDVPDSLPKLGRKLIDDEVWVGFRDGTHFLLLAYVMPQDLHRPLPFRATPCWRSPVPRRFQQAHLSGNVSTTLLLSVYRKSTV